MAQLIDTSVFIALERRGQRAFVMGSTATSSEPVALAAITASELLAGVHRADSPERRLRREAFVEAILSLVPVLPFDLQVARTHAHLWAQLSATGQPLGAHDLLIAATALAHGFSVLTDNLRDFHRVPGLTVRRPDW
jgi:tRNA(fMet)-specific endonuclease VapC